MSPDKLEKYILDERDRFDDLEPDPAVWDRIGTRPAKVVRINWRGVAWKAAAVVAIFTASYYFHDYVDYRRTAERDFLAGSIEDEGGSPIVKELVEAEAYYTAQINLRKEEVLLLTTGLPDVQKEIDLEIVELDKVFEELKEDLKDNADNEEVIEAMIQNYRLKLDILEEMLSRLKESHEPQNTGNDENKGMEM
jgi:hypothetical protein